MGPDGIHSFDRNTHRSSTKTLPESVRLEPARDAEKVDRTFVSLFAPSTNYEKL